VSSHTRKQTMNARIKIGWVICNVDDYVQVNRCFKCSKYNDGLAECRGEESRHVLSVPEDKN